MNDVNTKAAKTADKTADMTASQNAPAKRSGAAADATVALYGQIGISAVAAAARYQGDAKNPAYAPAPIRPDHRDAASV